YLEYFLFFIMVRDSLKDIKQAKFFIAIFLFTAFLTAIYSNVYIEEQLSDNASFFRVVPPVETRKGQESNTLGGYFIFMMGITAGILLYTRSLPIKVSLICLELAMFRGFLYTLSRGSYLAFVPMIIALVYFTKQGKIILIYVLVTSSLLFVLFMPQIVRERILTTITIKEDFSGQRIEWEASPQARLDSWKVVLFERFPRSPFFGHGVAKFFIDGQIFLTLCEVGLVGLFLLGWVFLRLFIIIRNIIELDWVKKDDFAIGLSIGFLSAFIGMLFHGIGTNTFIVIKTMEPFWFMAAIVISLPQLLRQQKTPKTIDAT
ncbi:MAG: O-antigen ligase family protein, partial [Candidatus Omnitrophica bacterium]|nr:O-antigen ligase family protein [Candidatus Omnitrophota bacterium]